MRWPLVSLLTLILPASAQAEPIRWATANEGRFGATIDYPSNVFISRFPPDERSRGVTWRTNDNQARFSLWGTWRSSWPSVTELFRVHAGQIPYRDYERVTDRFFVVSGVSEGRVVYDRCNFPPLPDGIIDCFSITYPVQEKAWWDPIVTRMSRSLRGVQPSGGEYRSSR